MRVSIILLYTQQKMQVDLKQQYQQFAHEQKKQLSKFIEVQESRFRAIEQKRLETDELVKSVESDVTSMKGLFQSHLRKVEEDMDAMRDTREQIAMDLLAAKSSIKEEVL